MTLERFVYWFRQEVTRPVVRSLKPVLFALAFVWRRTLRGTTFIAITGSVGKTTTKECLAAVLARQGRTFRSYRTQNNPLMVALNVLRVRPWHRYAVIEAAGAEPGMLAPAARILRPDMAVVLNVKRTHTRAFVNLDDYAREKATLLRAIAPRGVAIVNADDDRVRQMPVPAGRRVVRFGAASDADVRLDDAQGAWPDRFSVAVTHRGETTRVDTQLVGTQWVSGVGAAMASAIALGIDARVAASWLRDVPPFAARLQPVTLPGGVVVLRDDIGASVDTVEPALRVLDEAIAPRKLLVMTDVSDFGKDRRTRLKYLGQRAGEVADVAVFIGERAEYGARRAVDAGMRSENAHGFSTLREAAEFLRSELREGDLVLLKGRASDHASRVFFAQLGTVGCWKDPCRKQMLCDICWELDFRPR
jgi:UDP-N-acetylmuramoyl-tripeptide--D-alanyl-D-alanine ligase